MYMVFLNLVFLGLILFCLHLRCPQATAPAKRSSDEGVPASPVKKMVKLSSSNGMTINATSKLVKLSAASLRNGESSPAASASTKVKLNNTKDIKIDGIDQTPEGRFLLECISKLLIRLIISPCPLSPSTALEDRATRFVSSSSTASTIVSLKGAGKFVLAMCSARKRHIVLHTICAIEMVRILHVRSYARFP